MKKILVAVLAASMMLSPAAYAGPATSPTPHTSASHGVVVLVWAIFGCSAGITLAALAKNYWRNRQLTATEAVTCGIAYWFTPQPAVQVQDINTITTGSRIKF